MKLLKTQADIIQAYRERIRELGLTHATVDALSGLPDGYTSKIMCPTPMKNLGPKAVELLNGALAIGFVVTVDEEQRERISKRWTPRARPLRSSPLLPPPQASAASMPVEIEITPELQRKMRMSELGKLGAKAGASKGGKKRAKMLGKRARQRIAAHAARMRWSRERERRSAPQPEMA